MSSNNFQMSCSRARDSLSDYLEDLLPGESREAMRRHLESCADCRTALRREKQLLDALDRIEKLPAPPGFAERALAAILPEIHPGESILPRLLRGLALAAALFLLVMVLGRAFHPSPPELPGPIVDTAAQTLLERGGQIGEGLRTFGRATGTLSDTLEPFKILGRAGGLVLGNMPASFLGFMIFGLFAPVLLIVSIVLRNRTKGVADHAR